jgi:hypothetical protein
MRSRRTSRCGRAAGDRTRGLIAVGAIAVALLLTVPLLAAGHADDSVGTTSQTALGIGAALLGALGFALIAGRRRNVAALVLAVLLGVAGLEGAVHSVHHLTDPESGQSCRVLSATQHLTGALAEAAVLCSPVRLVEALTAVGPPTILSPRSAGPDAGRAPPASPSA